MMWCMRRTNIYLDDATITHLDHLANAQGVSRAEVVREMIQAGLANQVRDEQHDIRQLDLTFGIARDIQFHREGNSARETHLDEMWAL